MTTADEFEAEYGSPVFQSTFQAFAEGLDGNGILDSGDLQVTAGATSNGLDVAATTRGLWYNGTLYTYAGGTDVLTLSANTSGSDRWDLVYFDTGTTSPAVREGTPATKPDLPLLQAGEFPLAAVYVADGQTDVADSEIRSLRVHGQAAEDLWLEDAAGDYSADDLETLLPELVSKFVDAAGDSMSGDLDLGGNQLNSVVSLNLNDGGQVADDGTYAYLNPPVGSGPFGVADAEVRLFNDADLTDDGTVLYEGSTQTFVQSFLGGPASSLTSYPLPIADLNSPYALPSITDMDADGNDLSDTAGPGVLYDASLGEFPRGVLDDERTTTTVTATTYSTSDEEVVLVDTATIGAASTITLSSADAENGHTLVITDLTGSASSNPITIDTEGAETVNGSSSFTLSSDYVGATFVSDGANWTTTSSAPLDPKLQVEGAESGEVVAGEQGTLIFDSLADGETLEISKAIFTLDDGSAVPTSLDLIIATLDNAGGYTSQTTIYSGDGSTIWDGDPANSIGDPLASYTNGSGSRTTVAVLADNGTGSNQSILSKATGKRVP